MTRKKVTLAYITNDSERKASFKKRKKGLIKKVSELSTLCGVDACAIIYSQYDQEPEVWPSPLGAQAVLARFRKLSEMDQTRKMVNQESFTRQRIKKAEDQLRRVPGEQAQGTREFHVPVPCRDGHPGGFQPPRCGGDGLGR
ncbi:UNVERIFIED_CONTAM: Agamous-like MADS-box protein [Sesamum latifolium]|uniref:Agamous-like MADS-box protein n=1 Tax=Sesamum latifolium TaxID=2727402 RepID=A0AAW2YER9_9LAMI